MPPYIRHTRCEPSNVSKSLRPRRVHVATIGIDLERKIGSVDRRIFGNLWADRRARGQRLCQEGPRLRDGEMNSFEAPDAVRTTEHQVSAQGRAFDYTFPAHSVTMLRLVLE